MSHKICGTGHGGESNPTASTNCRSGARGSDSGGTNPVALTNGGSPTDKGLGIGSEDSDGKALTKDMYDTLVTAFDATDAVTSESGGKKCLVKAGSAFDETPNNNKIKPDVAGASLDGDSHSYMHGKIGPSQTTMTTVAQLGTRHPAHATPKRSVSCP
ncbi:MAG: hypothetical protein ACTJLL_04965 [Anaplasma sp.]